MARTLNLNDDDDDDDDGRRRCGTPRRTLAWRRTNPHTTPVVARVDMHVAPGSDEDSLWRTRTF
jgi:hypothetical protein